MSLTNARVHRAVAPREDPSVIIMTISTQITAINAQVVCLSLRIFTHPSPLRRAARLVGTRVLDIWYFGTLVARKFFLLAHALSAKTCRLQRAPDNP